MQASIKALLSLMLPGCRVFLDVDNLTSIASLEVQYSTPYLLSTTYYLLIASLEVQYSTPHLPTPTYY